MANSSLTPYDLGMVDFESRSSATIAMETGLLLLLSSVAITGNLLVILSFYRSPSIRTITNYFVLSLSIVDIIIPCTVLPPTLIWSVKSRFAFDKSLCSFQAVWSTSLLLVSLINITTMSINRFVCVCKPHKYKKVFNHWSTIGIIVGFWIAGFVAVVCTRFVGHMIHARFSPFKIVCVYVYTKRESTNSLVRYLPHIMGLGMPFGIMLFCYYNVFKTIRRHKKNIAPLSRRGRRLGTSVQEIKITQTLFAVLLAYSLTWIPFFIVLLAANLFNRIPREAQMVVTYTAFGSGAINPLIYGIYNKAFRQEYKNIFTHCCRSVGRLKRAKQGSDPNPGHELQVGKILT